MIRSMGVFRDGTPVPGTDVLPTPGHDVVASLHDLRRQAADTGGYLWISLMDPSHDEVQAVAGTFDLDPLLVDDAVSRQQRAKLESDGASLFVLLKVLAWIDSTSDVETGQVGCFIAPDFVISIWHGDGRDVDAARTRLAENRDLAAVGPMAVFWAIADLAIDQYLEVGDAIQSDVEEIEQQVFSSRPADAATRIYRLNRENIEMRRAVRPLVPEAMRLARGEDPSIPEPLRPYFRDIGDHILRANDIVDGFDSVLMTMLMASTARQDLLQNADMRKISAWAAIIAVPTAIAGIYGMNFEDMPELHWALGYPITLALMATICLLLYRGFKKSGWL